MKRDIVTRMDDSLVAQRKSYGALPRKAIIPEDTSLEAVWRWEVQLMDLLPADKVGLVRGGGGGFGGCRVPGGRRGLGGSSRGTWMVAMVEVVLYN